MLHRNLIMFFCLVAMQTWSPSGPLHAQTSSGELTRTELLTGFTERAFLGMNRVDVEAAFKTLARTVGITRGYDVETSFIKIDTPQQIMGLSSSEGPGLIAIDTWSYLELADEDWLEPLFVPADRGRVDKQFLLIVNQDKNYTDIATLRGMTLNQLAVTNTSLMDHWLENILLSRDLGKPEDFFAMIRQYSDPLSAVLPVFFGQVDAALIDKAGFNLMIELNPQLQVLQPLAVSDPLVNAVLCLNRSGWQPEAFRMVLLEELENLHASPAGQQILTLFKIDRLVPFQPEFLDTVRKLRGMATPESQDRSGAPARPEKSH
ncbi:MAG: hypothetical protein EA399_15500 [Desulfovibrionales bacterium]|nr:MAG: hypothetical protein EA399_15500 [Desulfovibrionales bacterium]